MNEFDIKQIVEKFEATVPPGDNAAAQQFFDEIFPHFSSDMKAAFLREALVSAIEEAADDLGERGGA